MAATTQIAKWGNSLGVRLPKSVALEADIDAGDAVDVSVENGAIVIRPSRPTYSLEELVGRITSRNRHGESDCVGRGGRSRNVVARQYVPDAGDLVWLTFDPQAGHERRGRRPADLSGSYNRRRGWRWRVQSPVRSKAIRSKCLCLQGARLEGLCSPTT